MHLALYRKYRPRTFAEVISQPHITVTLQNQIKAGQIAHAYLFMGSRGTGKTSCAKILAKAVNCTDTRDGNPCLVCESCKTADTSPDVREMDAASNRRIEDVREILEEVNYLPNELKYKVYIIDEVHMLTTEAFNALLKTLEEPPRHVVFMLATTEVHKVPATILSRCQRYDFNRINAEESAASLVAVSQKEGITLDNDAAMLISRLSDGGMRDALSLLDVAVAEAAVNGGAITQTVVRDCAGIAGKEHIFAITDAIAARDGKTALSITAGLYAKSKDPSRLIDELLQHFRNLMIIKLMPGDFSLIAALPEEYEDYNRQAALFTIDDLLNNLDKLEDCLRIKGRKVEAEICLMRMCIVSAAREHLTVPKAATPVAVPAPTPAPIPVPVTPVYEEAMPPPPTHYAEPPPMQTVQEPPPTMAQPPIPPPQVFANVNPDFPEWGAIVERLGAFEASMLEEASVGVSGDNIVVSGGDVLALFFENRNNVTAIENAAREVTGRDYKAVFNEAASQEPPPQESQTVQELPHQVTKISQFLLDVKTSGIKIKTM
ncbi:MAG: DNA polymerase III subunit gamma/tau [Oscillospiraceae bacterium]|nr:DNA polymerase III subunit gamma/tau [Oscillospiraceae bacterium]